MIAPRQPASKAALNRAAAAGSLRLTDQVAHEDAGRGGTSSTKNSFDGMLTRIGRIRCRLHMPGVRLTSTSAATRVSAPASAPGGPEPGQHQHDPKNSDGNRRRPAARGMPRPLHTVPERAEVAVIRPHEDLLAAVIEQPRVVVEAAQLISISPRSARSMNRCSSPGSCSAASATSRVASTTISDQSRLSPSTNRSR